MKKINNEQALEVVGGGSVSYGIVSAFAVVGAFLVGLYEGFMNPTRCK